MSSIVVAGDTSGSVTLSAPAVAGSTVLTLPSVSGTVTTNTTLAGADANIHGLTVGFGGGNQSANTSLGYQAGLANTTGNGNVFTGFQAGLSNTTGISNVFVGGTYASSAGNKNTTGSSNTGIGTDALQANTTASNNTAVGYQAGYSNTTGLITVFGKQAGYGNTTGTDNCAIGDRAFYTNTTGIQNTTLGTTSLYFNTTGGYNTAIGVSALQSNTTASNNTAVGNNALFSVTTGGNNTALGQNAGFTLATGTGCTYLGYNVGASGAAVVNELAIATQSGTVGKGSNTGFINSGGGMYQGSNGTLWSITSDQRLKKNIVDNTTGLSAINAIQVRNFEYRTAEEVTELEANSAIDIKGIQLGVIAQELQLILPECVKTESTGVMSVDATNLTWYLINAVKELSAELDALKLKVGAV